jgi:hypothetical protein
MTSRMVGPMRLAFGLAQGLALYLLFEAADAKSWPATDGLVFAPLLLVALFGPVVISLSAGNMRTGTLWLWTAAAAVLLTGLAVHDIARGSDDFGWWWGARAEGADIVPSASLVLSASIGLFIAQTMIAAGEADRRLVASYAGLFDAAWKHAFQLALAVAFVGVFWALVALGTRLFKLIELDFLEHLIAHPWFSIPATTLVIAAGLHITDVQIGLVRGARALVFRLLAWLLPLLALIVVAFLASLAVTGLGLLRWTQRPTSLLLTAVAALVVLINAAYGDDRSGAPQPLTLRAAERIAALTLIPLVALAAYAVSLRVTQHGWTSARIEAAAVTVIAGCYGLGYAAASIRPSAWQPIRYRTNVVGAFSIIIMLFALFTPIADPARLAVADQVARLESGRTSAKAFDFRFLRFGGARYGREALQSFRASANLPDAAYIAWQVDRVLALKGRRETVPATPDDIAQNLTVYPTGRALPESFLQQDWAGSVTRDAPRCLTTRGEPRCEATMLDLDGDGAPEILVRDYWQSRVVVFKSDADRAWRVAGTLSEQITCSDTWSRLRDGEFERRPAAWPDLQVGDIRLRLEVRTSPDRSNPCR